MKVTRQRNLLSDHHLSQNNEVFCLDESRAIEATDFFSPKLSTNVIIIASENVCRAHMKQSHTKTWES